MQAGLFLPRQYSRPTAGTGGAIFAGTVAELEDRYRHGDSAFRPRSCTLEVPVIAAVNGAVGAGLIWRIWPTCVLLLNRPGFGETFLNLGIIPGDGGAWFLQRLVGYQRACELTFSGRMIDAQRGPLRVGLVLEVVPDDDLMPRAALASHIAQQPAKATRLTKRLLKLAQRTITGFSGHLCRLSGICRARSSWPLSSVCWRA